MLQKMPKHYAVKAGKNKQSEDRQGWAKKTNV